VPSARTPITVPDARVDELRSAVADVVARARGRLLSWRGAVPGVMPEREEPGATRPPLSSRGAGGDA
jgi:3'-phosphoadenosine 5'-phosphosulfate sulfotransferase